MFLDYFNFNGKPTILLDEITSGLSLARHKTIYDKLIDLSKDFQIIIADHSLHALFSKEANLIDLDTSADKIKTQYKQLLNEKVLSFENYNI